MKLEDMAKLMSKTAYDSLKRLDKRFESFGASMGGVMVKKLRGGKYKVVKQNLE